MTGSGYIPALLNPVPEIHWDSELAFRLAAATAGLAKLESVVTRSAETVALGFMILRIESLANCALANIQCSLDDFLRREIGIATSSPSKSVDQTLALFHSIRLAAQDLQEEKKAITIRSIASLHDEIAQRKGSDRSQLRRTTQFIEEPFADVGERSKYTPPPPKEMHESLLDLEYFMKRPEINPVFQMALAFAQFDTLRPFYDDNARVCRTLPNLILVSRGVLSRPVLPISVFFARNRDTVRNLLAQTRNEDALENWLKFFFIAVEESCTNTVSAIEFLLNRQHQISENDESLGRFLIYISIFPTLTAQMAAGYLNCSFSTAQKLLRRLEQKGLVTELTRQKRNRIYQFHEYFEFWKNWEQNLSMIPEFSQVSGTTNQPSEKIALSFLNLIRERFLDAGLREEHWTVTEKPLSLTATYYVEEAAWIVLSYESHFDNTIELRPTETQILAYKQRGPHLNIEIGSGSSESVLSWSFALKEESNRVLWLPAWNTSKPYSSTEIVEASLSQLRKVSTLSKITEEKQNARQRELQGKQTIIELFTALKNVLGRQHILPAFFEDDSKGTSLVFHSSNIKHNLWFSLDELLRVSANELLKQRIRERITDSIRRVQA